MNRVLITGAAGFIGSHLTELCAQRGMEVRAYIHYNSSNNQGWLEKSPSRDRIEIISGDVRDYDSVYSAVKGCDTVFHLAALIGIPYSYVSPLAYVKTNVEGTYNILQASKELGVRNVLVTSTSETYGTAQYVPIDEKHPANAQSPYAASKVGADQLALSYHRSFNLPVKIVRPFNTFGPRQSARAIIPTIITQMLNHSVDIKLGNLTPTRDFTYVKDTVSGFIAIAESEKFIGEITNIGMSDEISIARLVEVISRLMGHDIDVRTDEQRLRPEQSEVHRLYCDNTKLVNNSTWRPQYTIEDGLRETIEWFSLEQNNQLYKSEIYNI